MGRIRISEELAGQGVKVCALEATPAQPGEVDRQELDALWQESLAELRSREGQRPATIASLEALQARYRGNRQPIELPPMRIARQLLAGEFRRISPLVDVYNLWSARFGLCIGAFDSDRVKGVVSVRETDGSERFHPIGARKPQKVQPGGFAYVDESKEILCWLDVRQGESTKTTLATRTALVLIEGIDPLSGADLRERGKRLADSLIATGAASAAAVVETVPGP